MAKLFSVYVYDSGVTHWALARNEELARMLPPEDVAPDKWWQWKAVCGREIVAHTGIPSQVNCKQCVAALERARKTVAELRARFGDGIG